MYQMKMYSIKRIKNKKKERKQDVMMEKSKGGADNNIKNHPISKHLRDFDGGALIC